jgi:putative transcriptional regulator
MTKVGNRLIEAANEALAIARGDLEPTRHFIPADIDVRAIRAATKLTQEDFSAAFGFPVSQIRDWEQHRSRPLGGVRAYLMLIGSQPEKLLSLLDAMKQQAKEGSHAA